MSAPSFICPRCGAVSYNPRDVLYGYCGACHDFTRTRVVDYPDILPGAGERRAWPETEEAVEQLKRICRQSRGQIVPWQGHNLYKTVHGTDAPADKQFTLEEISELCRRYIAKCKDET